MDVEAATDIAGLGGRGGRVGLLVLAISSTSISFSTEVRLTGKNELSPSLVGSGDGKYFSSASVMEACCFDVDHTHGAGEVVRGVVFAVFGVNCGGGRFVGLGGFVGLGDGGGCGGLGGRSKLGHLMLLGLFDAGTLTGLFVGLAGLVGLTPITVLDGKGASVDCSGEGGSPKVFCLSKVGGMALDVVVATGGGGLGEEYLFLAALSSCS